MLVSKAIFLFVTAIHHFVYSSDPDLTDYKTLYVGDNICPLKNSLECDGTTRELSFDNIAYALNVIGAKYYNMNILLIATSETLEVTRDFLFTLNQSRIFSELNVIWTSEKQRNIVVKLVPEDDAKSVDINFEFMGFQIIVPKKLIFERISINCKQKINTEFLLENSLFFEKSLALFQFPKDFPSALVFRNLSFKNFFQPDKNYPNLTLVIHMANNNLNNLVLEKVNLTNLFLPEGFIKDSSLEKSKDDSAKITLLDTICVNLSWNRVLINSMISQSNIILNILLQLNNSVVYIKNLIYFNSSLQTLLMYNSTLTMTNTELRGIIVSHIQQVTFMENNKVLFENVSLLNLEQIYISDMNFPNEAYRSWVPVNRFSLLVFEKNNEVTFKHFKISNISFLTPIKEEMHLLIFKERNKVAFSESVFSNGLFISSNHLSIIIFDTENEVNMKNCTFDNITIKSSIIQESTMRAYPKLIDSLCLEDLSSMRQTLTRITVLQMIAQNQFKFDNLVVSRLFTVIGGFAVFLYENYGQISNIKFESTFSETSGGVFLVWSSNLLKISKINTFNSMSVSGGFLYAGLLNMIIVEESTFGNLTTLFQIGYKVWNSTSALILGHNYNIFNFKNNTVENATTQQNGGCFLFFSKNTVMITDSIFKNIKAFQSGGYIHLYFENYISMMNVTISNSESNEGGVFFLDQNNYLISRNLTVNKTIANQGGFIYSVFQNTLLFSSIKISNIISIENGTFSLLVKSNRLVVLFGEFVGFDAFYNGGILYAYENNAYYLSNIYLNRMWTEIGGLTYFRTLNVLICSNISFTNILNYKYGGFLFFDKNNIASMSKINASLIESRDSGAFAFLEVANILFLSQIYLTNLNASRNASVFFTNNSNRISIENGNITDCMAREYGGIAYLFTSNILLVRNITFTSNSADISGSVLFISKNNTLNLTDCLFKSFHPPAKKGILLYANSGNKILLLKNLINADIEERNFIYGSNFIFLNESNSLQISNTSIYNTMKQINYSTKDDLIISYKNNNVTLFFSNISIFTNINAILVANQSTSVSITRLVIRNSFVSQIFLVLVKSSVRMKNLLLENNTSSDSDFLIYNSYFQMQSGIIFSKHKDTSLIWSEASEIQLFSIIFNFCRNKVSEAKSYSCPKLKLLNKTRFYAMKIHFLCSETTNFGGQIYAHDLNNFTLQNSTFLFSRAWRGGGGVLTMVDSDNIFISENKFFYNLGRFGGVMAIINSTRLKITKNIFLKNKAFASPIFDLKPDNKIFQNDEFFTYFRNSHPIRFQRILNNQQALGGCLYFLYDDIAQAQVLIASNEFIHNEADIGAVYFTDEFKFPKNFIHNQTNNLKKNKANLYGQTFGSNMVHLMVFNNFSELFLEMNSFNSSISLPETLSSLVISGCYFMISGIDHYKQLTEGHDSLAKINNLTFKYLGEVLANSIFIEFNLHAGYLCAKSFLDSSKTPFAKEVNLTITPSVLPSAFINNNDSFQVFVHLRNCTTGEHFDENIKNCVPCPSGFYSFTTNFSTQSTCQRCVNKEFYCYGGRNLTPKQGFWRIDEYSPNFLKCPNRRACIGDTNPNLDDPFNGFEGKSPTGNCASGYKGVLCSECESDFGRSEDYQCGNCLNGWIYLRAFLKLALKIFLFGYSIFKALKLTQSFKKKKTDKADAYELAGTNSVIKIILNHTHILRTLFLFPFDWNNQILETINSTFGIISPSLTNSISFECLLRKMDYDMKLLYFQLLINLLLPLFFALLYIVFSFINFYRKKREKYFNALMSKSNRRVKRRGAFSLLLDPDSINTVFILKKIISSMRRRVSIESITLLVFMLSWVDIAHAVGHTFFHINIGFETTKSKRVLWQPEIIFDSKDHMAWIYSVSIPVMVILGFFLPLYLVVKLSPLRKKWADIDVKKEQAALKNENYQSIIKFEKQKADFFFRYGYFYYPYKESRYYYELIYLARRNIFILFDIFIMPLIRVQDKYSPSLFLQIATIILWVFYLIQAHLKPYHNKISVMNRLESLSLTTLIFSYFLSSLLLQDIKPEMLDESTYYERMEVIVTFIIFTLILAMNAVFLAITLQYFFNFEWKNLISIWKKIFFHCKFIVISLRKRKFRFASTKETTVITPFGVSPKHLKGRKNEFESWESEKADLERTIEDLSFKVEALESNIKQLIEEKKSLNDDLTDMGIVLNLFRKESLSLKHLLLGKSKFVLKLNCPYCHKNSFVAFLKNQTFVHKSRSDLTMNSSQLPEEIPSDEEGEFKAILQSELTERHNIGRIQVCEANDFDAQISSNANTKNLIQIALKKHLSVTDNYDYYLSLDVELLNISDGNLEAVQIPHSFQVSNNLVYTSSRKLGNIGTLLRPKEKISLKIFLRCLDALALPNGFVVLKVNAKYLNQDIKLEKYLKIEYSDFAALLSPKIEPKEHSKSVFTLFSQPEPSKKSKKRATTEAGFVKFDLNTLEPYKPKEKLIHELVLPVKHKPFVIKQAIMMRFPDFHFDEEEQEENNVDDQDLVSGMSRIKSICEISDDNIKLELKSLRKKKSIGKQTHTRDLDFLLEKLLKNKFRFATT